DPGTHTSGRTTRPDRVLPAHDRPVRQPLQARRAGPLAPQLLGGLARCRRRSAGRTSPRSEPTCPGRTPGAGGAPLGRHPHTELVEQRGPPWYVGAFPGAAALGPFRDTERTERPRGLAFLP